MASTASPVSRLSALLVAFLVVCCPASLAAPPLGKRYRVGGPEGWRVPPPEDKEMFYVKWASPITFFVEDSIVVYKNDTVIKVSKAGYYHCNETAGVGTGPVPKDGSTLFLLDAPGFAYFASADLGHCADGQRLMINVLAAEPPAPASWLAPAQAPTVAPSPPQPSASSFPPGPGPAPSMEYSSAAGASFLPWLARAVASAAVLVLAGFV